MSAEAYGARNVKTYDGGRRKNDVRSNLMVGELNDFVVTIFLRISHPLHRVYFLTRTFRVLRVAVQTNKNVVASAGIANIPVTFSLPVVEYVELQCVVLCGCSDYIRLQYLISMFRPLQLCTCIFIGHFHSWL
jgi:hypothetical protein